MMPLAKLESALLGAPGRTEMVGMRKMRPSMKPLRLKSLTRSSPMAFCAPYELCGNGLMVSGTLAGSSPPKTDTELVKTTPGLVPRSEEGRVGKDCGRTCSFWWLPDL